MGYFSNRKQTALRPEGCFKEFDPEKKADKKNQAGVQNMFIPTVKHENLAANQLLKMVQEIVLLNLWINEQLKLDRPTFKHFHIKSLIFLLNSK